MFSLPAARVVVLVCSGFVFAFSALGATRSRQQPLPQIADPGAGVTLFSSSGPSSFKAGAGVDTFCLYGGPGSLEGKFQQANGTTPDQQGWTHRDVTDQELLWQLSTFNSPTGTQAAWAGRSVAQEPGWATSPGYGNGWNEILRYRKQVSDPSVGQVVSLSFVFNHDSEPAYDFFTVYYDSLNSWVTVLRLDGSNKDSSGNFVPIGFPADVEVLHAIEFTGNDYSGTNGDEIVIRLAATSDGAWSDEDGLWPSDGYAQVDEITVTSSEGTDFEDFESGWTYWEPEKAPFAGDFSKLFPRFMDIDPCREDLTPLIGFLDDGTPADNNGGLLWTGDPIPSIGTTSSNWSYGIPGGWIVNYNGGVSFGSLNVDNEWWSPEIDWDLAGTADDGVDVAGAFIRFSVWRHLPLFDGMFYQWSVRGRDASTGYWSAWDNRNFVYYSSIPDWLNVQQDVSDLLPVGKDKVQLHLALRDLCTVFGFGCYDATPAPLYDNVSFQKYRVGGPTLATRNIDLFQDSFSQSGLADVSTQAARDLLDCRVDMARSVSTGLLNVSGDSIIVDIESIIPGVAITDSLTQINLHYNLSLNPVFESAIRSNAPVTTPAGGRLGWDLHEGTVSPTQSTTSAAPAQPIPDRYAFDLPDEDFMYPGDVLEYYVEAVDDEGRTSTLPANLDGFGDGSGNYSRVFTVRALPTYKDSSGDHPKVLWWNDFGHRGGEEEALLAFKQSGFLQEGVWFDSYTTKGPSSLVDNGLGSAGAHGATLAQLSGYRTIVYESGDLTGGLMSDGTDTSGSGGNTNDKGDDVGLLTAWHGAFGEDRNIVHFGDNLASYLAGGNSSHTTYLGTVMGVTVNDADVRDEIDGQTAPRVMPTGAVGALSQTFVAYGGCPGVNTFDSIQPAVGAVSAYGFELLGGPGPTYPGNSAAVVNSHTGGGGSKKAVSFPYGLHYIQGVNKMGLSARSLVLDEVLDYFGNVGWYPDPVPSPPARFLAVVPAHPNPFNPRTTLKFTLGREASGTIKIYNVRGELVRVLASGSFAQGGNELVWDGRDGGGSAVASGIYVVRFDIDGFQEQQKVALLK